jgi:hypothetical protein
MSKHQQNWMACFAVKHQQNWMACFAVKPNGFPYPNPIASPDVEIEITNRCSLARSQTTTNTNRSIYNGTSQDPAIIIQALNKRFMDFIQKQIC